MKAIIEPWCRDFRVARPAPRAFCLVFSASQLLLFQRAFPSRSCRRLNLSSIGLLRTARREIDAGTGREAQRHRFRNKQSGVAFSGQKLHPSPSFPIYAHLCRRASGKRRLYYWRGETPRQRSQTIYPTALRPAGNLLCMSCISSHCLGALLAILDFGEPASDLTLSFTYLTLLRFFYKCCCGEPRATPCFEVSARIL